jgi:hypothetical protein
MYARMVSGQILPEKLDEAIQLWSDSVGPSIRQQKGFIIARFMINRQNHKVMAVGMWMNEADILNSMEWSRTQIEKFLHLFIAPPVVEVFEVAAEAERVF